MNEEMTVCTETCASNITFLGRVCINSIDNYNPSFSSEVKGLITMYGLKYTFSMITYISAALLGVTTFLMLLIIYMPKIIYLYICALFFMLLGMAFYLLKNV